MRTVSTRPSFEIRSATRADLRNRVIELENILAQNDKGIAELRARATELETLLAERDKGIAELRARATEQETLLAERDKRIAELEEALAKAKKNSRNSSKPPSSDIINPPPDPKRGRKPRKKRKIGGQPGHPKHESALQVSDADHVVNYGIESIPDAATRDLVPATDVEPKVTFQHELVDRPIVTTAHVAHPFLDRATGELVFAPFPPEVEAAGILGPRLTALMACIKGSIHASYSGCQKILAFLGVHVSRSTVCNKIDNVSNALGFSYEGLEKALPNQSILNIDETGHKDNPFGKPKDDGANQKCITRAHEKCIIILTRMGMPVPARAA